MKKSVLWQFVVLCYISLLLVGCRERDRPLPVDTPIISTAQVQSSPVPINTATSVPSMSPTAHPTAIAEVDLSIAPGDLYIYPVARRYEGDLVSVQILGSIPDSIQPKNVTIDIFIDGLFIERGNFSRVNLAGNGVGIFEWIWDSKGAVGEHQLDVWIDLDDQIQVGDENPNNNYLATSFTILPLDERPLSESEEIWERVDIAGCCEIYVIKGTAAARDIEQLKERVQKGLRRAIDRLDEPLKRPFEIYFINRVIGQGGYAGNAIVISYLDRQYVGIGLDEVLTHEIVHLLDQQFSSNRIPFLAEGVAVWATGGHYKEEDLQQRALAARELGQYIPLAELIDDFYPSQHEIGYLEAGAFIDYLVSRYSWEEVRDFYADTNWSDGHVPSQAVDYNLQKHFNLSLGELEREWLLYLDSLPYRQDLIDDLETTVYFYEVMRLYQQHYDPTAYFLYAWLPSPSLLLQRNITADVSRHPELEINIILELMLMEAEKGLHEGDFIRAKGLIATVERTIKNHGRFRDPLGKRYEALVKHVDQMGYEIEQVDMNGQSGTVWVSTGVSVKLKQLIFQWEKGVWIEQR